jgi:cell division protein FtsL
MTDVALRMPAVVRPRPAEEAERAARTRPRLEVVSEPQRRVRLAVALGVLVSVAALFALVAMSALLAQGQFEVDRLGGELELEQQRYEDLRREVAEKASPEQIVAAANELGLVVPDTTEYIEAPIAAPSSEEPDATTSTLAETWAPAKVSLGDSH